MIRRTALVWLIGYIGCCFFAFSRRAVAWQFSGDTQSKRPVSVTDVIEMTQTGDRGYLDGFTQTGNVALFSPDKSKFAFVTQKGNLASDTVEFSLLVFQTADVFAHPHAEVVATLASSSNREAISHVEWLSDNKTLIFLGEGPGEVPQVYRVDSTTKILEKLTDSSTPILTYAVNGQGNSLVYVADVSSTPTVTAEMRRRGFVITSQRWDELYTDRASTQGFRKEIFAKTAGMKSSRRVGDPLDYWKDNIPLSISPDGRFAIVGAFATKPPPGWSEYKAASYSMNQFCSAGKPNLCPEQYLLVDLESGKAKPLLNAPRIRGVSNGLFAWTRENSVLLVNALLPLDDIDPVERENRRKNFYTVEIFPPSGRMVNISERHAPLGSDISSDWEHDRFTVQPSLAIYGPPTEFRKDAGGWHIAELPPSAADQAGGLSVTLEQDMNAPPKLVFNDPLRKRKALLLDLNPQFAQLRFGHVETFRWKTKDGRISEGSLYYPPDYVTGKKYPLVIQTHGHSRERFWIDGPFSTAFAAQPLASHGFLVLQMGIGDRYEKESLDEWVRMLDTPGEPAYTLTFFESAVDELDRRGLIDTSRIGITGFSRTSYHVLYALTHANRHYSAAVVADGVNYGYVNCLFYLVESSSSLCQNMNGGGPPFGATLAGWEKAAPTFNLDKIESPLLLQGIIAPVGEWEVLAGLRWLKKPVEMLNFYPEGQHVLVRPQQRLLSQGTVVDWYRFWLKGEEDPNPTKAEQYRRWRNMREQRGRSLTHGTEMSVE